MDPKTVKAQIKEYVAENLLFAEAFPYADDASFLGEGIVDSVGVMELVAFVNTQFGVTVEPQEITPENFDSVQRLGDFIARKRGAAAPIALAQSAG